MRSQQKAIDYANIAFNLPTHFLQVYKHMTADECESIVDLRDSKQRSILDIMENRPEVLTDIFQKLSPIKISQICAATDKNNQTLLHRLAERMGNRSVINVILTKLPQNDLAKLLLIIDKSGQTFFHSLKSICKLELFQTLLTNEAVQASLNQICLIQDFAGRTILHSLADAPKENYFISLLQYISDEMFDKILILKDADNKNIIYKIVILCSLPLAQAIHQKAMNSSKTTKSGNYTAAIFDMLGATRELPSYYAHLIFPRELYFERASAYLAMIKEVLDNANNLSDLLTSPTPGMSDIPLMLFITHHLHWLINHLPPSLSFSIENDIKKITETIFENVSARKFLELARNYVPKKFFLSIDQKIEYLIATEELLDRINYIPYLNTDPLMTFAFFNTLKMERHFLTKIEQNLILNPTEYIIKYPQVFIKLYSQIVEYQISLRSNLNQHYLYLLLKSLQVVKLKIQQNTNPDSIDTLANLKHQIEMMILYLRAAIEPIDLQQTLALTTQDNMTLNQFRHSADHCYYASIQPGIDKVSKLRLENMAISFLYKGAKNQIALIETKVEDEKPEIIVSLDDEELQPTIKNEETKKIILLLNTRVNYWLDLENEDCAEDKIDEVNYELLSEKYKTDIITQNRHDLLTHLKEFSDYLNERAKAEPFLMINTRHDYLVRKALFDALTTEDSSVDDLESKIKLIKLTPMLLKLTWVITHRCADILAKLIVDFKHRLYAVKHYQLQSRMDLLMDNEDELYNRKLTVSELENIITLLPSHTRHIRIDASQCASLIDYMLNQNHNIMDYFDLADEDGKNRIRYIFFHLTSKQINPICLITDKHNRTVLHKLTMQPDNKRLIETIIRKLTPETLCRLLLMQDGEKKTFLHYSVTSFNYKIFDKFIHHPQFLVCLNVASTLQDSDGNTILHYYSEQTSPSYFNFEILLKWLGHVTIDNLLSITNKHNASVLTNLFAHQYTLTIEASHKLFLATHIHNRSDNYPNAILHVIKHGRSLNGFYQDHNYNFDKRCWSRLMKLIGISVDIIQAGIKPRFLSQTIRSFPDVPAIFEILFIFSRLYESDRSYGTTPSTKKLLALLNVIPVTTFMEDYHKFYGIGFAYRFDAEYGEVVTGIADALSRTNWAPYISLYPHALSKIFRESFTREKSVNNYYDYLVDDADLRPKMAPFIEFISNVIHNQLRLFPIPDVRIIATLKSAIAKMKDSPQAHELVHIKKLQSLLLLLEVSLSPVINPDHVIKIEVLPDQKIREHVYVSDLCLKAAEHLPQDDVRKARLNVNAMRFLYQVRQHDHPGEDKEATDRAITDINQRLNRIVYDRLYYTDRDVPAHVDEDAYSIVTTRYIVFIKEVDEASLLKHQEEFCEYITHRAAVKPSLFSNSEEDFKIRKAYYDVISITDQDIQTVRNKLETINEALNNTRLKGIISHQCLDRLAVLKTDYENILFRLDFTEQYPQVVLNVGWIRP